MNEKDFN
jgi:Ca2+-binding EF-hand superfamily protein